MRDKILRISFVSLGVFFVISFALYGTGTIGLNTYERVVVVAAGIEVVLAVWFLATRQRVKR